MNEENPVKELTLEKKLIDKWLDGFIKEDPEIAGDYHYLELLKIAFNNAIGYAKSIHDMNKNKGE